MDYLPKPSLQLMCMRTIAIELWTRDGLPTTANELEWRKIMLKLEAKVRTLLLPAAIIKEAEYLIKIMGSQMLEWFAYLLYLYDIHETNPKGLRWSTSGAIDKEKSAELLVADQSLGPKARFQIACDYGFEKQIRALSSQSPPDEHCDYDYMKFQQQKSGKFWRHYLNGEEQQWRALIYRHASHLKPNMHSYLFKRALRSYNPVAVRYYYAKFNLKEKENAFKFLRANIINIIGTFERFRFPKEFLAETLYFLLSRMSEQQLATILSDKANPEYIFSSLLVWPYHHSVLTTVYRNWAFFKLSHFKFFLSQIFDKINYACEDCVYRDILREIWQSSPDEFKKGLIDDPHSPWFFLYRMFRVDEEAICRMMLKSASVAQANRMLLNPRAQRHFLEQVKVSKKWKFVAFFIEECGSSRETIDEYKQLMINYKVDENEDEETREFLLFLDNFNSESK